MWNNRNHVSTFETYGSSSFPTFIFYDISFFSRAWMSELLQSSSVITETWNICCLSTEDWCKHLNTKGPPAAPILRQLTNISCQSETRPSDRRRSHIAFFFFFYLRNCLTIESRGVNRQSPSVIVLIVHLPRQQYQRISDPSKCFFLFEVYGRLGHAFWVWCIKCLSAKLLYARFTILKLE